MPPLWQSRLTPSSPQQHFGGPPCLLREEQVYFGAFPLTAKRV